MSKLQELGALWLRDGATGKFMSGSVKTPSGAVVEIIIFKNKFKQQDIDAGVPGAERKPDYKIYLSEPREPRTPQPASAPKEDPFFANPDKTSDGSDMPEFKGAIDPKDIPFN